LGDGKAAGIGNVFMAMVRSLKALEADETLCCNRGKTGGDFPEELNNAGSGWLVCNSKPGGH